MKTEQYTELKGIGKQQPLFEGVQVQAELRETLSVTTITQSYHNPGTKNIEAVYTFPLPLDAVFLDMTVTLGDTTLKGIVLPKKEAEEQYEEAIVEGDAPVMLQNPQPGLYTMNVGNLLPGEKATIIIRYGLFMLWQGQSLRYHLPTTIAPRFGSAEGGGMAGHQTPETSLMAENLFSFQLKVSGALSRMAIASPSHGITVSRNDQKEQSTVTLTKAADAMDRDLIITIARDEQQAASAALVRDGDQFLLWAHFQPCFGLADDTSPRSIKIVVDCSGSMAGDSITQAREALLRVLDELRPQDWFNIVAFGNNATPLFNAQVKATAESLAFARGFLKKLDADMGGTEIGPALELAVRLKCPERIRHDVLLITDGEIWEWERVVKKAQLSGHRFFTVGVGSAVSEAFVRSLADKTCGACELVSPNEAMVERIHRQFRRLATPCSSGLSLHWPSEPLRQFPEQLSSVFDGDTRNCFAWFAAPPAGEAQLKFVLPDGSQRLLSAKAAEADGDELQDDAIPRMAAALVLRETDDKTTGQALAVKYRLVSQWTNYLAVVLRDDEGKADSLPELHKVQQMLAAGWGGMGTVPHSASQSGTAMSVPCFMRNRTPIAAAPAKQAKCCGHIVTEPSTTYYQSGKSTSVWIWDIVEAEEMERFVELLDEVLSSGLIPGSINLPLLPIKISESLAILVNAGNSEQTVVAIFLHLLAESSTGEEFSRQARRVITKLYKSLQVDAKTVKAIEKRFKVE